MLPDLICLISSITGRLTFFLVISRICSGVIRVEKLGVEAGETVTFDSVIAVSNDGLKVGEDVKDASVTASVVENGKAKKVIVYKYKRKTGYHKKNGHRQQYTKVKIEKINA